MPSTSITRTATRGTYRVACILLVDDDSALVELLADALRGDGHMVLTGSDGRELTDYMRLSRQKPLLVPRIDLIISDIRMPHCTGFQALENLKAFADPPPILLMTAFGSPETHSSASRLGAAGVIDKPFDVDDFRLVVHHLLEN